jgi:hypothetical protein
MAAIVPRRLVLLLFFAGGLAAQQNKAIYQQISRVATALTSGNPEEALVPIDKACPGYATLRDYFTALTNAYNMTNDLEVTDEQIVNQEATLTVHWILTLSDLKSDLSETRTQDLTIKLSLKKFAWQIVSISPLDFFNPELRSSK